jgi:hypothetical protein
MSTRRADVRQPSHRSRTQPASTGDDESPQTTIGQPASGLAATSIRRCDTHDGSICFRWSVNWVDAVVSITGNMSDRRRCPGHGEPSPEIPAVRSLRGFLTDCSRRKRSKDPWLVTLIPPVMDLPHSVRGGQADPSIQYQCGSEANKPCDSRIGVDDLSHPGRLSTLRNATATIRRVSPRRRPSAAPALAEDLVPIFLRPG